jgi:hypothetical protein
MVDGLGLIGPVVQGPIVDVLSRMVGHVIAPDVDVVRVAGLASVDLRPMFAAVAFYFARSDPPVTATLDASQLAVAKLHAERARRHSEAVGGLFQHHG